MVHKHDQMIYRKVCDLSISSSELNTYGSQLLATRYSHIIPRLNNRPLDSSALFDVFDDGFRIAIEDLSHRDEYAFVKNRTLTIDTQLASEKKEKISL